MAKEKAEWQKSFILAVDGMMRGFFILIAGGTWVYMVGETIGLP